MKLLRKLNTRLGATVGYEVRRVRRPPMPAVKKKRAHDPDAPVTTASPLVAFRPPREILVDRLLRRPVFIMSPVRSGSTLLRLLLNAHSQLHSPHELHVRRLEVRCSTRLAERSMEQLDLERGDLEHLLWDRVMHRELVASGKEILVEKTPSNTFAYRRIADCWPDARFIFLLRHPASIATSWHEADPEKRTAEEAALDALRYMRATERARNALPGHTVRYEDLTADPETTLKDICAFLELPFEPEMLDYGSRNKGDLHKGLGDWKEKIRTGTIQAARPLPAAQEIPELLGEISRAWGYTAAAASPATTRHAEIAQVWPRDGRIRLVGHVPDAPAAVDGARWRLLLTLRGSEADQQLSYDAPVDGAGFDVSFPVADLAIDDLPLPCQWDIHLVGDTGEGEVRLRAGRHLDDVTDKKKVFVFPEQPVAEGEDAARVRPYYTIKNNLSIECRAPEHDDEQPV